MNAYTEIKLKLQAGQRIFRDPLVSRLLAEHEALRTSNAKLRETRSLSVEYIGGAEITTEDGQTLYCDPVPVVILKGQ